MTKQGTRFTFSVHHKITKWSNLAFLTLIISIQTDTKDKNEYSEIKITMDTHFNNSGDPL